MVGEIQHSKAAMGLGELPFFGIASLVFWAWGFPGRGGDRVQAAGVVAYACFDGLALSDYRAVVGEVYAAVARLTLYGPGGPVGVVGAWL